jgi:cytoskeleton protein RodZ
VSEVGSGALDAGGGAVPAATASTGAESAGAMLRRARQAQGLHIAVLAAALKVSPHKLELLESDRFDELPGVTFVRALAQAMCRHLKIDPEPILAQLPSSMPLQPRLEKVARGLNTPFREHGMDREPGQAPPWMQPMVWLPALLVLLALAFWFAPPQWNPLQRDASPFGSVTSAPDGTATSAATSATTSESAAVRPAAPAASETVSLTSADSLRAAPARPASAPAVVDTVHSAPVAESPSAAASGALVLRATEDSWVEIRDASGAVLLSRALAAGEAVGLDGTAPFKLKIGNAAGTQVVFRNQPVDLAASTRENVARLVLN